MQYCKTYKSGLRLVARKMPSLFTVSFGVFVNVGSVREEGATNGYSHFIEHMLFKGTKRFSAVQISEAMDDIGAQMNAFTSKDMTCYYTKSASVDLEKCVDLLSDMYFNSVFDETELSREKKVVIEEIDMGNDNPEDVCQDLLCEAAYNKQKMGQTIVGTAQNIEYSDRHSILNFKNKYYVPSNTVISVAGNFDADELDKLIEKYFEPYFADCSRVVEDEEKSVHTSLFLHRFKDTEQSHVALAYDGVAVLPEEDRVLFSMMSNILGGGLSSRLFQTIREQNGLAYSVGSYPSSYQHSGFLTVYCGTNPKNLTKLHQLLSEELQKFVKAGISEKELERTKAQLVNGMYMSMENSMSVMTAFGRHFIKCNEILDVEARAKAFNSATVEQVNALTRKVFASQPASCYVGKEVEGFDLISQIKLDI